MPQSGAIGRHLLGGPRAYDCVHPAEWLTQAITAFRDEASRLRPEAADAVTLWNMHAPCQVRDYWVQDLDLHHFCLSHFPWAPDAAVTVVGPLRFSDLFERLEVDLDDEVWAHPIGDRKPDGFLRSPWERGSYREAHRAYLMMFASRVRSFAFQPLEWRRPGLVSASIGPPLMTYIEFFGPLADLDPTEIVRKEVGAAAERLRQRRSPPVQAGSGAQDAAMPQERRWDGWCAYLSPALQIGERPKRSFRQDVLGYEPEPFARHHSEFIEVVPDLTISWDGFIAVRNADQAAALRRLNLLGFVLGLRGAVCDATHPANTASYTEFSTPFPHTRFQTMGTGNLARRPASEGPAAWMGRALDAKRRLTVAEFQECADLALVLARSRLADDVEVLLQAETLLHEGRSSAAALVAWGQVERESTRLVDEWFAGHGVPEKAMGSLDVRGDRRFRLMRDLGLLPGDTSESLERLRVQRNEAAHGTGPVDPDIAKAALKAARQLLLTRLYSEISDEGLRELLSRPESSQVSQSILDAE